MNNLAPAPSRGLLLEIYLVLNGLSETPWFIAGLVLRANTQTEVNPYPNVQISRSYLAQVTQALHNGTAFGYFKDDNDTNITTYRVATLYEYQLKKDQRTQDASISRSEKYLNEKRSWWRKLLDRMILQRRK